MWDPGGSVRDHVDRFGVGRGSRTAAETLSIYALGDLLGGLLDLDDRAVNRILHALRPDEVHHALEVIREETPLGVVLVAQAAVDEAVRARIEAHLPETSTDPRRFTQGPLRHPAARADLALSLELIDRPIHADLRALRDARDLAARHPDQVRLDDLRGPLTPLVRRMWPSAPVGLPAIRRATTVLCLSVRLGRAP